MTRDSKIRDINCLPSNCYIVGPTGPMGPQATIQSILIGNDGTQMVASRGIINLGELINNVGTSLSYNAPDTITINQLGTYFINVSSIINNANVAGDLGISLEIDGVIVPTASEYIQTQTAAFSSELQHSFNAVGGENITLVNNSTVANNYHDITISVFKLV